MRSLSIKLLAEDVKNAKCPSSLFVVSEPAIPLIWATNLLFHCQFIFARVWPALPLFALNIICLAASFGVVNPKYPSPPTVNLWPGFDSLIPNPVVVSYIDSPSLNVSEPLIYPPIIFACAPLFIIPL